LDLSGPRLRDVIPRKYRPVYDAVLFIMHSIFLIGVFLLLRRGIPHVYVVILLIIAVILSGICLMLRLLFGNWRL
jgi:hypothetical protein